MPAKTTLVIATRNEGKINEIKELLKYQPVEIKNLNDFGPIPEIVEDGETFDDNAYKKSSMTARMLGLPTLADDSGLVVAALGGAPGVLSARYAGKDATDRQRCEKLLQELAGRSDRRAFFQCVISIAVPSGPALTYEAVCHGFIAEAMAGAGGFGYDPIFYYPELNKTFAEMNLAEKNRISHRARALMEMTAEFDKVLAWIRRHSPAPQRVGCGEPGHEGA